MRLARPALKWKEEHENYVREWGPSRLVPSSFDLAGHETYEEYLKALAIREGGTDRWLPSTNYFLIDDNERIVAMVDIRHDLNEFLRNVGGHIGYSTRPSERKKGYATLILAEALKKCKELGIDRVLVTCDEDNIGSAKVVIRNGGIEDESFADTDGTVKRRFWIDNKS
ncbi:GNAT family N-acetyltransferase [Virgibacillus dakarensis]|uniref:GNAT family N-acetyltransferase n=1 Tax=Virgibacillus dakarensis TaxID=1917889 RepID=UPI000B4496F1|nr:GNAT family N-acetyltransferase [Virgibacillus dakarensis]MBT2216981.1 GNAT family N-acetyltransferase [Virgibacillus dakarensis]MTW87877.1 GNAT family N-acetyltransferase [Virgibacillus dakarensis]